jgi:hydrogenase nickel incorporation protein HypA/HybF
MHEYSLVEGIVKLLHTSAEENQISKISKVNLVVGQMTMALPDALQFAFEVIRKEDPLLQEDAVLEIREEPVRGQCKDCGRKFDIKHYEFICPDCASPNVKLAGGRELYIDSYEGD